MVAEPRPPVGHMTRLLWSRLAGERGHLVRWQVLFCFSSSKFLLELGHREVGFGGCVDLACEGLTAMGRGLWWPVYQQTKPVWRGKRGERQAGMEESTGTEGKEQVYVCTCVHACVCIHVCAHVCVCACACMCVSAYLRVCAMREKVKLQRDTAF